MKNISMKTDGNSVQITINLENECMSNGSSDRELIPSVSRFDPRIPAFDYLVGNKCEHPDSIVRNTWLKVIGWPYSDQAAFALQVGILIKNGILEPEACKYTYEGMTISTPSLKR